MPQPADPTSAPNPNQDDEIEDAFPGFTLTHVLGLTARDELGVAIAALEAIRACGGGLEGLQLSRRGESLDHRLKITGLRAHQARALADRLAALPGVERTTIEHQLLRR